MWQQRANKQIQKNDLILSTTAAPPPRLPPAVTPPSSPWRLVHAELPARCSTPPCRAACPGRPRRCPPSARRWRGFGSRGWRRWGWGTSWASPPAWPSARCTQWSGWTRHGCTRIWEVEVKAGWRVGSVLGVFSWSLSEPSTLPGLPSPPLPPPQTPRTQPSTVPTRATLKRANVNASYCVKHLATFAGSGKRARQDTGWWCCPAGRATWWAQRGRAQERRPELRSTGASAWRPGKNR